MTELIDRKSLHVNDLPFSQGQCQTVQDWLDMQPTVEAKPVVHAYWKENPEMSDIYRKYYQCSNCRRTVSLFAGSPEDIFPYCHCGAKMVEEVQV